MEMNVDIERMSKETDIGVSAIKNALGIPLEECKDSTIEEVRAVYDDAPDGSEAQAAAFNKCIELASTIEEVRAAYNDASYGSEAESAALEKWNKLSLKAVEEASTIEEVRAVYDDALDGSEAESAAIRKLSEFFRK
ncbi:MAG: hypothetical protein ABIF08_03770 [Nanoarchaeota archaeon]